MKNWTDIQNSRKSQVTGALLWLVAAVVFAQNSSATAYQLYPYVIVLGDQQPTPEITDQQFFDLAGRVVFPVNRSELPADTAATRLHRRELLSIKTNLLLDLAYMPGYNRWCPIPNVAVEYYPKRGHFTFGGSFDMPWWQHYDAHKYFQVRNYQLETRYYLTYKPYRSYETHRPHESHESYESYKAPAYSGFYLQGYAHVGIFGICFDADRGWVGEGAGAGVGCGYVMPLSKNGHWRLELGVQAGYFRCKYDPYQYENPVDPTYTDHLYYYKWSQEPDLFKKRQYRFNWFGPTRIGITLSYDLLYRKTHPRPLPVREGE